MLHCKTSPALYSQILSVDVHIRVYPDGNAYKAELYVAGRNPQRFRIGLTQHDVEDLNKGLQDAVQHFAHISERDKVSDDMLRTKISYQDYRLARHSGLLVSTFGGKNAIHLGLLMLSIHHWLLG